jgi:succinoglycan biosynthesis protein ExoL
MPKLIFFGHDSNEPAVRRRIEALSRAGAEVLGMTMRRGPAAPTSWQNVELGQTTDQAYAKRIGALVNALPKALKHGHALRAAEIFYARNLDMLALAVAVKTLSGSKARVVYECLDIHRLMTRNDMVGTVMRGAEGFLLRRTSLLTVSAPAFLREYFERRHPGAYRSFLIENRMPAGRAYPPRPHYPKRRDGLTVIGWFGNLRCARSMKLLRALAIQFPDRVRVVMRGYPSRADIPDFDAQVRDLPNFSYGGRYAWPEDLPAVYNEVDVVWAGDFHDPGANSRWLLPNRIYEGGYFAVPPIAPADSETGRWIRARDFGFTLPEPLEETLPDLIGDLTQDQIARYRDVLLSAPTDSFVQPETEMQALLKAAQA